GCECREIREAIAPWEQVKQSNNSLHYSTRKRRSSQTRKSFKPVSIPQGEMRLAILPEPPNDHPQANPNPKLPNWLIEQGVSSTAKETRYWYSKTQWVSRFEWENLENAKGHDKTIRPAQIKPDGTTEWKKGPSDWPLYRLSEALAHGQRKWVFGLEGEKCVEEARSLQLVSITWQGGSWTDEEIALGLKQLKDQEVAGLIYWHDYDEAGEKKAQQILKAASQVQFPVILLNPLEIWDQMPHKGDIANWVAWGKTQNMNTDDFIKRLEMAIHTAVAQRTNQPFEENDDDESEVLPISKPPKPDLIAAKIAEKYRDKWLYCAEFKTWMAYELEQMGVWHPIDDLYISTQVHYLLKAHQISGYGVSYLNNIVELLKRELYLRLWGNQKNLLPFSDCVLELDTGKTREHCPGNRLTWVLPRPYHVLNRTWTKLDNWLNEATGGNEQHKRILLCYAAAVLRRRADLQKFLHLIGIGGTGKSTFMNLLIALVGQQNTLSMDLETLNEKDALADLFGKVLVVFPDQDSAGRQLSNFKKLTGGDLLRGRRLYQDGFNFRFEGMCAVTSNNPIFHAGTGRWLTRRAIMIPFKLTIPDSQIRDLEKEFEPELSALTLYLLSIPESEIEAVLRGQFKGGISNTLWESQIRSDGLASWVNDWLIHDPMAKTQIGSDAREWANEPYEAAVSTLFGSYCLHCRQSNRQPLTKDNFSANLLELLQQTLQWGVEKIRTNTGRMITGVRLRTANDGEIPYLDEVLAQSDGLGDGLSDGLGDDLKALIEQESDGGDGLGEQFEASKNLTQKSVDSVNSTLKPCQNECKKDQENGVEVVTSSPIQSEQGVEVVTSVITSVVTEVVTFNSPTGEISSQPTQIKKETKFNCPLEQELASADSSPIYEVGQTVYVYSYLLECWQITTVSKIEDIKGDKIYTLANGVLCGGNLIRSVT
ncbi:DUF5906 domain-containing protein, partial [Chroococcus sp. FPU101]|uniref:DNA primase family protein n=1 Tax=Chroococcus sp. FPU101 TaxID=1974212 RepID=UPI001A8E6450